MTIFSFSHCSEVIISIIVDHCSREHSILKQYVIIHPHTCLAEERIRYQ